MKELRIADCGLRNEDKKADEGGGSSSQPAIGNPQSATFGDHRRDFGGNRYVYPVVSRRSRGVSVGLNLNPDKVCNFDCVYCQVDRTTPGPTDTVNVDRLREELEDMLDLVQTGRLFDHERFCDTPQVLRRLNDIAFSGDGEPTTCPEF